MKYGKSFLCEVARQKTLHTYRTSLLEIFVLFGKLYFYVNINNIKLKGNFPYF